MLLHKEIVTREIKFLCYTNECAILIIEKGKARNTRPTLKQSATYLFLQGQPFTIASSGRLFSILEDLITKTNKSDNEDTCLY